MNAAAIAYPSVPASAVTGRVPANDLDAEAAVLSACMQDKAALDNTVSWLRGEMFYSSANGSIYSAMMAMYQDGSPINIITIAEFMRKNKTFANVGGASYLAQIADAVPYVSHVVKHGEIVRDLFFQRQLVALMHRTIVEGYGQIADLRTWIDEVETAVHGVTGEAFEDTSTPTMYDVLKDVFSQMANVDQEIGIRTGMLDLDALMGPMLPGQMIVIGAHSGIGKTSMGMQAAVSVALTRQPDGGRNGVLVFSAEMTKEELAARALFSHARVDSSKATRPDTITTKDWEDITRSANTVAVNNIYFDDRSGMGPLQIRAKARRVMSESTRAGCPLKLILVDYLQLIDGTSGGTKNQERREREIAAVSVALKSLAKELRVPIIVLAQLNDDSRREKRPPRKEDLRECKAAAQDADKVILIWNQAAGDRALARRMGESVNAVIDPEIVDLIVDKNRGGKTGKVNAVFFPSFTFFGNATREDIEKVEALDRARANTVGTGGAKTRF